MVVGQECRIQAREFASHFRGHSAASGCPLLRRNDEDSDALRRAHVNRRRMFLAAIVGAALAGLAGLVGLAAYFAGPKDEDDDD